MSDPKWLDYLNSQKRKFESTRDKNLHAANQTFLELTRQLMLIDTVFIGFVSVLLTKNETSNQNSLIFSALAFFIISLFSGILHYFSVDCFFTKAAKDSHKFCAWLSENNPNQDQMKAKFKELDLGTMRDTPSTWLSFQIAFLVGGIILLLVIVW